jgi:hypothetical protein
LDHRAEPGRPLPGGDLLQKVGDIGRVQRLHQRVDDRDLAHLDRLPERTAQAVVERVGVARAIGRIRPHFVHPIAHACRSIPVPRADFP